MLAEIDDWIRERPEKIAEGVPKKFRQEPVDTFRREIRIMREDFRSTTDGDVARMRQG